MSDEETLNVSSDGSASDDDESSTEPTPKPNLQAIREHRPKHVSAVVDHVSLAAYLRAKPEAPSARLRMTKYEYARLKGVRLEQLGRGAIPCVPYDTEKDDVYSIFQREFVEGKMPLLVRRRLPDGNAQYVRVREFVERDASAYD